MTNGQLSAAELELLQSPKFKLQLKSEAYLSALEMATAELERVADDLSVSDDYKNQLAVEIERLMIEHTYTRQELSNM